MKAFFYFGLAAAFGVVAGCASKNQNDERATDFTAKQLSQASQLLGDFARKKSCDDYRLLSRYEGKYPSDTTRRLQIWKVNFCGTLAQMVVMTRKVPENGWEICISERGPCGIVDSGLFKWANN